MVEMTVSAVVLEPNTRSPIVVLKDQDDRRALLIWVGEPEANAIVLALESLKTPRPMTHDLLRNVLIATNTPLKQVRITEMRESTYFAELDLEVDGKPMTVDARPSDAIALALRCEAPIMVAEEVIAGSSVPINRQEEDEEFRKFLNEVKPSDFGAFGSNG